MYATKVYYLKVHLMIDHDIWKLSTIEIKLWKVSLQAHRIVNIWSKGSRTFCVD